MTIKVVIVDDSAFIRRVYHEMLSSDPEIEVVGMAEDPIEARSLIKSTNPDVITLDIEMPKMDGLSFLEKIMTLRPTPVVMSSTLTQKGADATLKALELGAVEVIAKPLEGEHAIINLHEELIAKVKTAAKARVKPLRQDTGKRIHVKGTPKDIVLAIGASTGGVETLLHFLSKLPASMPPILITQHMPAQFTESFARNLNKASALEVKQATNREPVMPDRVYLAPGSHHMHLMRTPDTKKRMIKLTDGENVSGHKPSVDVLFDSVAETEGAKAIGVILTGMGKDGAKGLLKMREAGATTFGQNEQSCVVYGMPRAAYQNGAVCHELSLDAIIQRVTTLCYS